MDTPDGYLSRIDPESYVVIDSMNGIERAAGRAQYLELLNTLKARLRETDSSAVLHRLDEAPISPPRHRTLTLKRADYVWELQKLVLSNEIKTRLLITKARGYRAHIEPIPLVLTDRVLVDTSRNIA